MIQSFADPNTERIWRRELTRQLHPDVQRKTLKKLLVLDAADSLDDLRIPPGNRLEKLTGDRRGQHSIRVNDQWRICFRWSKAGPEDVSLTDYH